MPARPNPLRLNPFQCRTLALLQALARVQRPSKADTESRGIRIDRFPHAHGDHFHIGDAVVTAREATGLGNRSVWKALERKGLILGDYPDSLTLTPEGLEYDSGATDRVLRRPDH